MTQEQEVTKITRNTTINIGLAIAILTAVIGSAIAGAFWAGSLESTVSNVVERLDRHEKRIEVLEGRSFAQ